MNEHLYEILIKVLDEAQAREIARSSAAAKIFLCSTDVFVRFCDTSEWVSENDFIDHTDDFEQVPGFGFMLNEELSKGTILSFTNFDHFVNYLSGLEIPLQTINVQLAERQVTCQ